MKPLYIFGIVSVGLCALLLVLIVLAHGHGITLLMPAGAIALAERDLMLRAVYLMLIVVVPVVALAILIAWHYRESNTKATYTPKWENSTMEELIWWSIPLEIVLVLAAITWTGTHELDPQRSIVADAAPYTVQVVALPWKWLFIYPGEGVASVNELAIPADRPIEFQITADAPMNSFWIPALGGQMYAMTGMITTLHLIASVPGEYEGRSANYSGEGFAQMHFTTRVLAASDLALWVAHARESHDMLSASSYADLRKPGETGPVSYYGSVHMAFTDIVDSFMSMPSMPAHHH